MCQKFRIFVVKIFIIREIGACVDIDHFDTIYIKFHAFMWTWFIVDVMR